MRTDVRASHHRSWSHGLGWNFGALAVAALAGLGANVLIAANFGPDGLGVFSQTLTFFALSAQLAVLGVHYGVLNRISRLGDPDAQLRVVCSGLLAALPIATAVASASFAAAPLVAAILDSPSLLTTVRTASVALFLHAAAKVVAAGLNGVQRMRELSLVNAGRGLAMIGATVILSVGGASADSLGVLFIASEAAALIIGVVAWRRWTPLSLDAGEIRHLLTYGSRATGAAISVEVNARVDVGVLGLFVSDRAVGIYAFAAAAFEGLLQVFVVLRNQLNPTIAVAVARRKPQVVDRLFRSFRGWLIAGVAAVFGVVVATFAPAVKILKLSPDFLEASTPLLILLAALVLAAPFLPFDQILVVGSEPGAQSRAVIVSLVVNVIFNMSLVPFLGGIGAAVGTAAAMMVYVAGISRRANRAFGTSLRLVGVPHRTGC